MDKPLDMSDLQQLKLELRTAIDNDKKYWQVNAVKCDAISTAKTYEEFSDRVAAAHLRPLDKLDKSEPSKRNMTWNPIAQRSARNDE
ncbi:dynein axonemal assembly factor 19 [Arctopsyche grandis]|uniref:dynein axonemal assembly factor 19 n=1 Tax=Arctopsyche grandis TaxID=121162 RepID=UPI00406D7591